MFQRFTCRICEWSCVKKDVPDPSAVKCAPCSRLGLASSMVIKKVRKDAVKIPVGLNADEFGIQTRPVRTPIASKKLEDYETPEKRKRDEAFGDDDESDEDVGAIVDADDPEYVTSPDFNPALRFSAAGTFAYGVNRVAGATYTKVKPWTLITGKAGRGNTNAQFGGVSAKDHAAAHVPQIVNKIHRSANGVRFEWCHLIADSLGGPTAADNLFCGSFHANTAQLCIECVLRGKTDLEVSVEVDVLVNTYVGLKITYRIRKAQLHTAKVAKPSNPPQEFVEVIDGLAKGCTLKEGAELSGRVRAWVKKNSGV